MQQLGNMKVLQVVGLSFVIATVLSLVAYLAAIDIKQPIKNKRDQADNVGERLGKHLSERSVPCVCPCDDIEVFKSEEVLAATEIRSNWTWDLEIALQKELDRSGKPIKKKATWKFLTAIDASICWARSRRNADNSRASAKVTTRNARVD